MQKKKSNFTISVKAEGDTAQFRITDAISESGASSAAVIRSQVDTFIAQGIQKAEVYINCRGGDCFEATEIGNELARFGPQNVKLKVGALAASAVTYLIAKFYTVANPNSQLMVHQPRLSTSGNISDVEADLKLLRNTTDEYRAAYALKTGMSGQQIQDLWYTGDHWMTAEQAFEAGFIDEIAGADVQTGKSVLAIAMQPIPVTKASYSELLERAPQTLQFISEHHPQAFRELFEAESKGPRLQAADLRGDWSFTDYQDKDPQALERIANHAPALFEQLFKQSFPSDK